MVRCEFLRASNHEGVATCSSRLGAQVVQHHLHRLGFALLHHVDAGEVAREDHRERRHVGHIEEAQGGDGDIELHRIDIAAENADFGAAFDNGADLPDQRRMQGLDIGQGLEEPCILDVSVPSSRGNHGLARKWRKVKRTSRSMASTGPYWSRLSARSPRRMS